MRAINVGINKHSISAAKPIFSGGGHIDVDTLVPPLGGC
jgi:hypothetical protein